MTKDRNSPSNSRPVAVAAAIAFVAGFLLGAVYMQRTDSDGGLVEQPVEKTNSSETQQPMISMGESCSNPSTGQELDCDTGRPIPDQ